MMETVMMMMMWVCWHSSYIPSYALGRGTRWYQETNLCLRSKASSTMGPYAPLSIFPPGRRDSQARRAPLGPCREHGAKHIPARQIIFNHNRTFVLVLQPPTSYNTTPWILPPAQSPCQSLHMNLIWPPADLTPDLQRAAANLPLFLYRAEMVTSLTWVI